MLQNICVIDDDPICVFGIKKLLKETNLFDTISTHANGLEAIQAFEKCIDENKSLPGIIFLDINMPIMDGWEFLEEFKKISLKNREHVRIYMVSSSVDPRDLSIAKSFKEVDDYFIKPITNKDIQKAIEN
jgi:CheY-like chemotaxis protein